MAVIVDASNLQKTEFNVTTAEGPSRVTIVTGMLRGNLQVTSGGQAVQTQKESFEALLDPQLAPGEFRKAAATASVADFSVFPPPSPAFNNVARWSIEQVEATLDDESGRIQLRIDVSVQASGSNTAARIAGFTFQVTTLSKPAAE